MLGTKIIPIGTCAAEDLRVVAGAARQRAPPVGPSARAACSTTSSTVGVGGDRRARTGPSVTVDRDPAVRRRARPTASPRAPAGPRPARPGPRRAARRSTTTRRGRRCARSGATSRWPQVATRTDAVAGQRLDASDHLGRGRRGRRGAGPSAWCRRGWPRRAISMSTAWRPVMPVDRRRGRQPPVVEHRTLLDVQLDEGRDRSPGPTPRVGDARRVAAGLGEPLGQRRRRRRRAPPSSASADRADAGPAADHAVGAAGTLLVGERHHDEPVVQGEPRRRQGVGHLDRGDHAVGAVERARRRPPCRGGCRWRASAPARRPGPRPTRLVAASTSASSPASAIHPATSVRASTSSAPYASRVTPPRGGARRSWPARRAGPAAGRRRSRRSHGSALGRSVTAPPAARCAARRCAAPGPAPWPAPRRRRGRAARPARRRCRRAPRPRTAMMNGNPKRSR